MQRSLLPSVHFGEGRGSQLRSAILLFMRFIRRKVSALRPAQSRLGISQRSTFVQAGDQIHWFAALFGLRALYTAAKPVADNRQIIDRPDGPMTSRQEMTAAANSYQLRDAIR
jgi:hypothetical protein